MKKPPHTSVSRLHPDDALHFLWRRSEDLKKESMKKSEVAHLIDHTILRPEATSADVAQIVEEGARLGTYSVCVSPSMLP